MLLIRLTVYIAQGSYCRWTKFMSTESGGNSDNEVIGSLVSKFPTEACSNPSKILARRVDTKQLVPATGWIQTLASYDVKKGFQCQQSLQQDGSPCLDYEVQLCCPGEGQGLCYKTLWRDFHENSRRNLDKLAY